MKIKMSSKITQVMTAKAFAFISVLLLTACDGGIFGTGGPDEPIMTSNAEAGALPDNTIASASTDGTSTSPIDSASNTGTDTGAIGTDAGTVESDSDAGVSDAASTTTDEGISHAGSDGSSAGTTTASVSANENGEFANRTPTLEGSDAQVLVVNLSTKTLNITSPSLEQAVAMFEIEGVAPDTASESTPLNNNATNLIISDNSTDEVLIKYSDFNADPSTLSTLLMREDEGGINAVLMVTETQTGDAELAKVRIVQGDTLGDASTESPLRLQSTGNNPGGMDINFGPLTYDRPESEYSELFAGDYELVDEANRFIPFAVTLSGGTVFTLVLRGNGMNDVLIIDDTNGVLLNP